MGNISRKTGRIAVGRSRGLCAPAAWQPPQCFSWFLSLAAMKNVAFLFGFYSWYLFIRLKEFGLNGPNTVAKGKGLTAVAGGDWLWISYELPKK